MGLKPVTLIAQQLRLVDNMRQMTTRESDILFGFRIQMTGATTCKIRVAVWHRFGISTKPPANGQACTLPKLGTMAILAHEVLVRVLAN